MGLLGFQAPVAEPRAQAPGGLAMAMVVAPAEGTAVTL